MGMEMEQDDMHAISPSLLLELAAMDDVDTFKLAVAQPGRSINQLGHWYTRQLGSKKMSYQQRTPLMLAAMYGSTKVLDFILTCGEDPYINLAAGFDGATALHCAVAGGSAAASTVVERLIAASANINAMDTNGNKPCDLIPSLPKPSSKKKLEALFNDGQPGFNSGKKEYPVELPDINNGLYSSDEFRMYCFKIKPCSRAYTHDWTECPFAHPGENARRRDPNKYPYTCVPCPEFKKGSCKKGDDCEFAHGVFESWLHPAQYRTRLCKDETGCSRKVCFFAHKEEELRPVYQSTGSGIPGPDVSTPPLSPCFSPKSGGGGGGVMWQGKAAAPPCLQLPGSRLRSSLSARDMDLEKELVKISNAQMDSVRNGVWGDQMYTASSLLTRDAISQQQQMRSPMASPMASPSWRNVGRKLSPPKTTVFDSPKSLAAAMMNSRAAAAFAKRSQSFVDRAAPLGGYGGATLSSANLADWGSPNGKLEWGLQEDQLQKLRKSNSFGFRGNHNDMIRSSSPPGFNEPDVSWVNSLVKDDSGGGHGGDGLLGSRRLSGGGGGGGGGGKVVEVQDLCYPWVEQLYIEQEQMVA